MLPAIAPAIASGTALAFARAMGEYGSVLLLSGGVFRARVSSMYAYQQIQNFDYVGAATTATVLLVVSAVVLGLAGSHQRRVSAPWLTRLRPSLLRSRQLDIRAARGCSRATSG